MPTLRPFRDYDEKDVINLFAWSGSIPTQKGTLVKIGGEGFRADLQDSQELLGNYGDFSVSNVVAQRYGVIPKIVRADAADKPLGFILFDVRETDENGELLKYRPRKAAEMEAVLSGQAVPVVTRGTFLYSGIVVSGGVAVTAGADAYAGQGGVVATSGTNKIGKFLGATGADPATALVWFNFA
jgi:hypothetical protein